MNAQMKLDGQLALSPEPTPTITKEQFAYTVYEHLFPDGKRYIGITNHPVDFRWKGGSGYSDMPKMKAAIDKFGWDNIEHRIIASGLSKSAAKQMEAILISEFDSVRNGYNAYSNTKVLMTRKVNKPNRDIPSEEDITKAVEKTSRNPDRDTAICLLLFCHGLRPSDVSQLNVDDWDGWDGLRVDGLLGDGSITISDKLRDALVRHTDSMLHSDYQRVHGATTSRPLFITERRTRPSVTNIMNIGRRAEAEMRVKQ